MPTANSEVAVPQDKVINVPESQLRQLLEQVAEATEGSPARRMTAVRWFNRLYYDVRNWNKVFIRFLRTYPGFLESGQPEDYRPFLEELQSYREGLDQRYSSVKHDLCGNLKVLSARYSKDFDWLYQEDPALYEAIRSHIDDSYATEDQIVSMAAEITGFIWNLSKDDPYWHVSHHGQIVEAISTYASESQAAVAGLHQAASDVGIALLSVEDYEEALSQRGSADPRIMIMGEVTVSQDKINITNTGGIVNVKSTLNNVTQMIQASSLPEAKADELCTLMEELKRALEDVPEAKAEDAQRVAQTAELLASEAVKENPKKSFLNLTKEGLKEAAEAVAEIAPKVLATAGKIAAWVGALA